jgi:hypothetical protein
MPQTPSLFIPRGLLLYNLLAGQRLPLRRGAAAATLPVGRLKMAGSKTRIMYIEAKSGHGDRGPARIGRVSFSATGKTLYYGGRSFQSCKGQGIAFNSGCVAASMWPVGRTGAS